MEAALAGTPVILTDRASIASLRNRVEVLYTSPDPDSICSRLADLLSDEGLRRSLAEHAMIRVQEEFSPSRVARLLEEAYLAALGPNRGG